MTFLEHSMQELTSSPTLFPTREYLLWGYFLSDRKSSILDKLHPVDLKERAIAEDKDYLNLTKSVLDSSETNDEELPSRIINNTDVLISKDYQKLAKELNIPTVSENDLIDGHSLITEELDPDYNKYKRNRLINPRINLYNKLDIEDPSFEEARQEFLEMILSDKLYVNEHLKIKELASNIKVHETIDQYLIRFPDNDFRNQLKDTLIILTEGQTITLPKRELSEFIDNREKWTNTVRDVFVGLIYAFSPKMKIPKEYFYDIEIYVNDEIKPEHKDNKEYALISIH